MRFDPAPAWRRYALLAVLDTAAAVLACYVAYRLRFEGDLPLPASYEHRYWTAGYLVTALVPLAGARLGLYRRDALRLGRSNVEPAFVAATTMGVALAVVNVLALGSDLSRGWIALVTFGVLLSTLASRELVRRCRRMFVPLGLGLETYLLVGDGPEAIRLRHDLTRAPGAPYRLLDAVSSGLDPDELAVEARKRNVDGLVLDASTEQSLTTSLALAMSGTGIDVLVAPTFGSLQTRVASLDTLHGVPLLRVAGLAPRRRAQRVRPRDRARHGVAVLGTRGIPANYGGFETFAERLALNLVAQGVPTTVYCRRHYATQRSPWRGVRLVRLPTIRTKYLDTVVHTFLSALHLVLTGGPRDVVLCNAANAPVLLVLRCFRRRVVLNVDGLEWRRSKWGVVGRAWYRLGEWLSVRLASVLVTDAAEVQTYYRVRHDSDSVMIAYGADVLARESVPVPAEVPVPPGGYVLYAARWEQENNPGLVARAHRRADCGLDLVMLGTSTYADEVDREVRAAVGPGAHLPGALFGDGYTGLLVNARCYVQATEVGGTHPALIEALGAGNLVLVLDTPENREVAGDAAVFYADEDELVEKLRWAASLDDAELDEWRTRAQDLVASRYSWKGVSDAYLRLLVGD
jgi:glycosyltransferase involved in cell wall biosynthesis